MWARAVVESIDTCRDSFPLASASARSAASTCAQTPSACQHANSAYTRHQGPYRVGTSRRGHPIRYGLAPR